VKPIIVSMLRVESVTGETCYAGENGFSALTAYVKPDDPAILKQLHKAYADRSNVVIRCAALEIEGRVGSIESNPDGMRSAIAISIVDLRYFKPKSN
jgi:hypothetical protein